VTSRRAEGGSDRADHGLDRPQDRAVYIISVAAELAGVHPQTLRIYERKGLLSPARTPGNTRRYSERDIATLQMIQRLTQEFGINLAGVKMIVEMENELDQMRRRMERLDRELARVRRRIRDEVRQASMRTPSEDIVPLSSIRRLLEELGALEPRSASQPSVRVGPIPVGPANA
jgi:MerR family transcriptional regulator/heat shock protein HspR